MAEKLVLVHLIPEIRFCIHDGTPLPQRMVVTSAEATEQGWKIAGGGNFTRAICPSCSQTYAAIQQQIPIHVSKIQCPRCGASQSLDHKVTKVTLIEGEFSFEATLTCPQCKKRNGFKKVLGKLADILSIEIGLTGITLKAKSK
jgi:hypothetical protein